MKNLRPFLLVVITISLIVGGLSGLVTGILINDWLSLDSNYQFFKSSSLVKNLINLPVNEKLVLPLTESEQTIALVKKISPAVVSVIVTKNFNLSVKQKSPLDDFLNNLPFDLKIEVLEGEDPSNGNKNNKQEVEAGSGFIVRSNGLILTNKHVVEDITAEYSIKTTDGKTYPATVIARDQFLDIALLKIEAENLPFISLGNSDKLEIGQTVVAIGNVLGQYQNTVTRGIVSGIKRRVVADAGRGSSEVIEAAIQTDAAINPGNSGGPLLNLRGEVIGINTAVNLGGQSVGFALPINSAKNIIESVEKYGRIIKPWLGVRYIVINKGVAAKNNLTFDYGALVVKGEQTGELAVIPGSPSDKAGIVENDLILEINGQKVTEENGLGILINKYKVGDEVSLKIVHKGETKTIKIKLEEAISN
ncbi:MAG: Protease Do [Candidatus Magasanikbacteria bacterium GW2011_GWC2_40_17]|uniref:Protease Do n=1 Tax=Candidatus Magasanikbacteria bacterium GW2011_GWA2_42_32 TaxID=1619039 RepID=A0A0G1A7E2_9BACT|nr:MAG: Protease Do [Candidatus Magasanikbacteria bacterium GW2011_GWC2_40_17]KKS56869.1 MAG: Protease Do [Candidatus Magasanikbacteria bacterium GW2011_GWA2_42_32]OGH85653.1 MAG: hypothetical protein A2294_00135 [Candidatus Magasanikbacteria bacterium RIFOXYB2_FULL_38_10]